MLLSLKEFCFTLKSLDISSLNFNKCGCLTLCFAYFILQILLLFHFTYVSKLSYFFLTLMIFLLVFLSKLTDSLFNCSLLFPIHITIRLLLFVYFEFVQLYFFICFHPCLNLLWIGSIFICSLLFKSFHC